MPRLKSTWANLKSDSIARIFSLTLIILSLPYLIPLLGGLRPYAHYYGELFLQCLILFAFQHRLREIERPEERRYWNYLTLAFAAWLLVQCMTRLASGRGTFTLGIAEDSVYMFYYLCFFFAAETNPAAARSRPSTDPVQLIRILGFAVFLLALFTYFILIPSNVNPGRYGILLPSYYLYISLDLVLVIRFAQLFQTCKKTRWRLLYGLTGIALFLLFVADILEWLHYAGVWEAEWGSTADLLWDLPLIVIVATARLRHYPFHEQPDRLKQEALEIKSPLVLLAFLFPMNHFLMSFAGLQDPVSRQSQELVAFLGLLILGSLAVLEHFLLAGRSLKLEQEKSQTQQEKAEQTAILNSLISNSPVAILLTDQQNRVITCSPVFEKLFQYSQSEIVGKDIDQIVANDEMRAEAVEISKRVLAGHAAEVETRRRRKDGTFVDVAIFGVPSLLDGEVIGAFAMYSNISERKKAEEALRLSEERFHLVSYATNDVIWDWEIGTSEIWWSSNLKEVFGYSPESDLKLEQWTVKVHPEDREQILTRMNEEIKNRQTFAATEYRFRRADGAFAHVLDRSCLVFDDAGKPVRMIGSMMDITERKRAEQELEQSLSLLRATLESTADGILVVDNSGKIVSFNQTFTEMWKIPQDILDSRDDNQALTFVLEQLKSPEAFLSKVQELYANPVAESFDVLEFQDGRVFERYSLPQMIGKESVGRVWSFQDVTKRYHAEKALRESEERYRTLFEESKDAVFISTIDGKIVDINPAGVELFGYPSREEFLKVDITRDVYYNPSGREAYEKLLSRQGYVKDYELTMKKKNGQKLIVLETSIAMKDANGMITGYRGIMRDVTEVKQMQEDLVQSRKMETIGRLAGGVAHDFNNLLMAISAYSELLLLKLPPADPLGKDVSEILKAAEHGASLTRQLLAFGRKQMLMPKLLDLNEVIKNLQGLLQRLIGEHIELDLALLADSGRINVDPVQIEQVIINLAANARDAMPGGGKLMIETANDRLDEASGRGLAAVLPGDYITMSMRDTGLGIDPETLTKVFEPFFTTKERGKGTGLGLSTAYGIVKQSGGHIIVSSAVNQGTEFKIFLPSAGKTETGSAS